MAANGTIQIKRSLTTATPTSLANGELAYSANGDQLFIGSNGSIYPVAGRKYPGTLTANQNITVDANSYISELKAGGLTITSGSGVANVKMTGVIQSNALSGSSNTTLATSEAIKAYVDAEITAEDLDITTDSGTIDIDLDSETLRIKGTSNEIETSATGANVTIGLPADVTVSSDLTVGANIVATSGTQKFATANVTVDLGVQGNTVLGQNTSFTTGITGPATFSSDITASGDIDVADNKEINVYTATVRDDATVSGDLTVSGNVALGSNTQDQITVAGSIVPSTNVAVDLGTSTMRFKDLYLSGSSLQVGDFTLSDAAGALSTEEIISTELMTMQGNTVIGSNDSDIVTFNADVSGNILPAANGQNLGSATARWDLASVTINSTGDATIGGDVDITGEVNAATAAIRGAASITGVATMGNDVDITGEVNAATAAIVGAATVGGNVTVSGDIDVANSKEVNAAAIVARTSVTTQDITINGNTIIGSNASDLITLNGLIDGNSTVGILPEANGVALGDADQRFAISGTTGNFSQDVTISGNLTISGDQTNVSVSTLKVTDPLISLNKDNAADATDTGFYGKEGSGTATYHGLFRDASNNGIFTLFDSVQAEPTGTVDTGGTGYAKASLLTGPIDVTTAAVGSTLGVTGVATFSDDVDIADSKEANAYNVVVRNDLTVSGNSKLGSAATDGINVVADVTSSILPSANGKDLGADTARWDLAAGTINSSGAAVLGGTLALTGVATLSDDIDQADNKEANVYNAVVRGTLGVTGVSTLAANLNLSDSDYIQLGASQDLQIYHDASHSYITDNGTGNLKITASQIDMLGSGETLATFIDDGAVTLYHDGSAKIATKSDGVDVTGELQADSLDIDGAGDISGVLTLGDDLDLANNKEANVYNAVVRNDLTVTGNTTLGSNTSDMITVEGYLANSTKPLNVNGQIKVTNSTSTMVYELPTTRAASASKVLTSYANGTLYWSDRSAEGFSTFTLYEFTTNTDTAGKGAANNFAGSDDNGSTLAYTPASGVAVYANGVLMNDADYTATNGANVIFDALQPNNSFIQVFAYHIGTSDNLTIASNNNIGINNTSPAHVLSVNGLTNISANVKATGYLDSSGNILRIYNASGTKVWG